MALEWLDWWTIAATIATVGLGGLAFYYKKIKDYIDVQLAKFDAQVQIVLDAKKTLDEAVKDGKITKDELKDIMAKTSKAIKAIESIWNQIRPQKNDETN